MADRYWVGGNGTWNTTNTAVWSASDGGSGGASVPTVNDNVFFTNYYDTITCTGALACANFTWNNVGTTFVVGTTPTLNVRGSWDTAQSGGYFVWPNIPITFSATTSKTIDFGYLSTALPTSVTFNGAGGTWTLTGNDFAVAGTTTLTAGTIALGGLTFYTNAFASSNSNTRSINFGTGKMVLTGTTTATIWNTATITGLTTSGTQLVECQGGGTSVTKTISAGALSEANSISFSLLETSGSVTYAFTASNTVRNLTINGVQTLNNIAILIYGNYSHSTSNGTTTFTTGTNAWTFAATSGTKTIYAETAHTFPWTFGSAATTATWQLTSDITLSSTRTLTLTLGTLSLQSYTFTTGLFASSNSNSRTLNFGTGKIVLTSATASTVWTTATVTNLTVSGTSLVECQGGGSAITKTINTGSLSQANAISFSLLETSGTVTYAFTANNTVKNLIINGSQTVSNIAITIYGDYTYSNTNGTTTFTAGANLWSFLATSGTQTITGAGVTHNFGMTFGSASTTATTFSLGSNLTIGSAYALTLAYGTTNFNNYSVTSGTITISNASNITLLNTGSSTLSVGASITQTAGSLTLPFNITTTGTYTFTAGTLTLGSYALTVAIFNSNNANARTLDFSTGKIVLNGSATATVWTYNPTGCTVSGTSLVECQGGGTGVTKTISNNQPTEANAISFSLLETTGTVTYAFTANNTVKNLIINGTQTLSNIAITIYGNYTYNNTNGTTTFTAGSNAWTFAATSGSLTITGNGATLNFPVTFGSAASTAIWTLASNLIIAPAYTTTLTQGTLSLGSYTLTTGSFASANSNNRTLAFDTGKIVLQASTTVTIWSTTTLTNLTLTGTKLVECQGGGTGVTKTISPGTPTESGGQLLNFSILETSGTASYVITNASAINNLIINGSQTMVGNTFTIYGNYTYRNTNGNTTFTGNTTTWTFGATSGTQTIDAAGPTHDFVWVLGAATSTATYALASNLTIGSTRTLTFTAGTLSLGTYTLTTGAFSSSNTNTRVISFGTGTIALVSTATLTIWATQIKDNFSFTGTPSITCSGGTTAITKTLNLGFSATAATAFNVSIINGTTASVVYAFTANDCVNNLTFSGTQTVSNITIKIFGTISYSGTTTFTAGTNPWVISSNANASINTGGATMGFPIYLIGNEAKPGARMSGTLSNDQNNDTYGYVTANHGAFNQNSANAYCIEFFYYTPTTPTAGGLYLFTSGGWILGAALNASFSGDTVTFSINCIGFQQYGNTVSFNMPAGQWYHIAIMGNSTGTYIGVNGVVKSFGSIWGDQGGYTPSGAFSASTFYIGGGNPTQYSYGGYGAATLDFYISQFRVVTALVYNTTGYNPPVAPLTAIASTILLALADNNTFRDLSTVNNSVTAATENGSTTNLPVPITIGTSQSPTFTLQGSLNLSTQPLYVTNGIFDQNNQSITAGNITIAGGGFAALQNTNGSDSFSLPVVVNTGTLTLVKNIAVTSASGVTLTAGKISLASYTLTTRLFNGSGTVNRIISFDTGGIQLNAATALTIWNTSTSTNLTVSGTTYISCVSGGASVTKTINTGSGSVVRVLNFSLLDTSGSTYTFTASNEINNLIVDGSQTITNIAISVYGNFDYTRYNGDTSFSAGTNTWTFSSTSTQTLNGNGATLDFPITINGVGGNVQLLSAFTMGSTRALTLTNGTLDLNGYTFSTGSFVTSAGTKAIKFNSGTLTILTSGATAFNNAVASGFTTSAGTGNGSISLTSSSAKTFVGGDSTYAAVINQGGTGNLTITGNNQFNDMSATISSSSSSNILITAGTTQSFQNFTLIGTSSYKPALLSTSNANIYTLQYISSGSAGADYVSVRDAVCTSTGWNDGTGYIRWYFGNNSTNAGNNRGALFNISGPSIQKVYLLETGTSWTVPNDFNSSNNQIHLYGGGGGGAGGRFVDGQNRASGGGGGGGGYTKASNVSLTIGDSISYTVGSGGSAGPAEGNAGSGGTTTFQSYTANGGGGGYTTTTPTTFGGTGGTGSTYNGGNGAPGAVAPSPVGQGNYAGGGGGGGSGGPNGNGAAGGNGYAQNVTTASAGGGGGGSGGGTAGSAGGSTTGGAGGNNYLGSGGGASTSSVANSGVRGGGGSGGTAANPGGLGSFSVDIGNGLGGGGGAGGGGGGSTSKIGGNGVGYGSGGGGGGAGATGTSGAGGAGGQGAIIIVYTPNQNNSSKFLALLTNR